MLINELGTLKLRLSTHRIDLLRGTSMALILVTKLYLAESMDDLKTTNVSSSADFPDGALAIVQSYYFDQSSATALAETLAGGGGGIFRLIRAGVTGGGSGFVDNGGTVIAPPGGGRWNRIRQGNLTVRDFGASPSASAVNNGTFIREAVKAVGKGGTLEFPPGAYLVNAASGDVAAVVFSTDQEGQTINVAQGATIQLGTDAVNADKNVVRVTTNNVAITGRGTIKGNATGPGKSDAPIIQIGISGGASPTGVVVEGVVIDGQRSAVAINHRGIAIAPGTTGATVRDVTVLNTGGDGVDATNVNKLRLIDVRCTDTYAWGINVTLSAGATANLEDLYISGCSVDRAALGTGLTVGGIKVAVTNETYTYDNLRVVGNYVKMPTFTLDPGGGSKLGIEVFGGSRAVSMVGNTVRGSNFGLSLDKVAGGAVTGNAVLRAWNRGIELASCQHVTVTGNSVSGLGQSPGGIVCSNTGNRNFVISANVMDGFIEHAIRVGDTDKSVISSNGIDLTGVPSPNTPIPIAVDVGGVINSKRSVINGNMVDGGARSTSGVYLRNCFPASVNSNFIFNLASGGALVRAVSEDVASVPAVGINYLVITGNNAGSITRELLTVVIEPGEGSEGQQVRLEANPGYPDWLNHLADVQVLQQSGSPGSLVAGGGSLVINRTGAVDNVLYTRTSGGVWKAVQNVP